jgi:type VI secretion system protein VasJ
MRTGDQWLWAASGKHPSSSDYFSIGARFPLVSDFSEWIKYGYPPLAERVKQSGGRYSWRFWARGRRREELVCGLLRDSHDCFGRPYPLLIIGTGPLPSWEEHWDKLPVEIERIWCRFESASIRKFGDLMEFGDEIGRTRPPDHLWSGADNAPCRADEDENNSTPVIKKLEADALRLSAEEMGNISLDGGGSDDRHPLIMHLCSVLKRKQDMAPNSLFIGGTNNDSQLVFFRRPMRSHDLTALWGVLK